MVLPTETTCIILWATFFNLTESKLQFCFLRAILKTNNRGNTDQLVTRCENRAVSAQSPTDRAQIFSVSTSHLQHKYSFHAFVRSANLRKLQCTSKERCDEITWQCVLLTINLLRIWSIKIYFPMVHVRDYHSPGVQWHMVCISAQMHICFAKENPHCIK